jgi:hypothetical protein
MKKIFFATMLIAIPLFGFADNFSHFLESEAAISVMPETDTARLQVSPMRIPAWGAFLINAGAGMGIGSYIQGEKLGGTIGLVGELGGLGLMLGGFYSMVDFSTYEFNIDKSRTGMGFMLGGLALVMGTRVFEYIRPWFFKPKEERTVRLTPSVDVDRNGNPVYAASLRFRL